VSICEKEDEKEWKNHLRCLYNSIDGKNNNNSIHSSWIFPLSPLINHRKCSGKGKERGKRGERGRGRGKGVNKSLEYMCRAY
jgi:hypothetical protein